MFRMTIIGEERIREELARQEREEELFGIEDIGEEDSEVDDEILTNNDTEPDDFFAAPDDETGDPFQQPDSDDCENREFVLGKDGETIWTTSAMRNSASRTPQRNIITHLPGAKGDARTGTTALFFLELFLCKDIVDKIVLHTNEEVSRRRAVIPNSEGYAGPTDDIEVKALIGFLYLCGATKNSDVTTEDLYSQKFGLPFFRCVMSRNRLKFLLSHLRFDSKLTRDQRRREDKLAPIREVWDIFNVNCGKYYTPSEYLTIDECLLSFRGRCPFKMYIPNKPDKYGLKIVSLCDARTFYFCGGIPYVGKNTIQRQHLLLPTCYAISLCENIKGTNRNVTADNWFTSYELAEELLERKLTYVGTMRKNKKEIPPGLLAVKGLEPMTSRFVYQPEKMLTSFSEKKNKNVILLSTMHDSRDINPLTKKPDVVELYNFTKGGVDCFDRMCHTYTTKRYSCRWPMRFFYGVLDMMGINGWVLFTLAGNKLTRQDFLKNIAYSLAEAHMMRRLGNPRIRKHLQTEIRMILGIEEDAPREPSNTDQPPHKKLRCFMCDRKKDRKSSNTCEKCDRPVCKEHEKISRSCLMCDNPQNDSDED